MGLFSGWSGGLELTPDYLRDMTSAFDSFRPDLNTFLSRFTIVYTVHSAIRGFAIMHYINLLLTLTLTHIGLYTYKRILFVQK